ncbi:glutamate synthase subunit beta [Streptomyces sp. NPDC001380]|uniref:glutamate synthase subunit beta n=1 Tax=Streptomyces sp. NPDC001380 TaxID=3364566 RepID=UPI0036CA0751
MADPKGFLTIPRRPLPRRPVRERVADWNEVHTGQELLPVVAAQADRCMDCGIPFCHSGCPLGNLIPEWNELAARGDWRAAGERLHATDNFPEFTGRLCPAPCESACVLGINADPVTIRDVEVAVADHAWAGGALPARPPERLSGRTVAVVGSGPAGLAAAQQLTRAGHTVTVYERADRVGGLLRYGIPEFKMEKRHLDRRIRQMREEGTRFRTGVRVGADLDAAELLRRSDAVVVAVGATDPRELPVPGRGLAGVHQAMEYLPLANRVCEGDFAVPPVTAEGRDVVIVGGGDTGADCLGTVLRQRAASVVQLDINPRPGGDRAEDEPWPVYPRVYRVSPAHEEARALALPHGTGPRRPGPGGPDPCGGADPGGPGHHGGAASGGEPSGADLPPPGAVGDVRVFSASTLRFEGDAAGRVRALHLAEAEPGSRRPRPGTERAVPVQLVLLALGFRGPERDGGLVEQLGLRFDARGTLARDAGFGAGTEGVFVAGDAGRGQSLVVWAIAEGRSAAAAVDRYLTGGTDLPAPVRPADRPLAV